MANFSEFTDQLREAMDTNAPAIHTSVTNFAAFTRRLRLGWGAEVLIAPTRPPSKARSATLRRFP